MKSDYVLKSSIVGLGNGSTDDRQRLVDRAAFRSGARDIEQRLLDTSGKGHGAGGRDAIRLRRAIFKSIGDINASTDVLSGALDVLAAAWPGVTEYHDAVIADFPRLIKVRYQWLVQVVKPALRKKLASMQPQDQQEHSVEVDLPSEFDLIPGRHGTEVFFNPPALEDEIEMLGQRLASR